MANSRYNYICGGFRQSDVKKYNLTLEELELLKYISWRQNLDFHDEDPVEQNGLLYYRFYHPQFLRELCFLRNRQHTMKLINNLAKKGFINRIQGLTYSTRLYLCVTKKYDEIKPTKKI